MPVVKDGLLFITGGSSVYAYNAKTGATVWKHQTDAPPPSAGLSEFTRPEQGLPNREGVAVGEGLVFVGLTNAHAIALREKTGEEVWDVYVGIEPARAGQGVSGAPVYANGLVFVGTSARHRVPRQGRRPRRQDRARRPGNGLPCPDPGEHGHETWPKDNDSWKTGGGARLAGRRGGSRSRPGLLRHRQRRAAVRAATPAPATTSISARVVALEIKTGKLRWYYQTIRHDIWEADIAQSPVLFDAQIGGRPRKRVAAMRTDGVLFMLDRETGKPIGADRGAQGAAGSRARTPWRRSRIRSAPSPCCPIATSGGSSTMPAGFELGCFFAPASLDEPNLLTPVMGHARRADGLQPADRILLRDRQFVAAVVPPRRGSLHLHSRRRPACRACRRATP